MVLDIVRSYIALLSEFFTLSDMATSTNSTKPGSIPRFVPAGSDSLTTSFYLTRLLHEILECINEVTAMEVSADANAGLKALLETATWKFEEALCRTWYRGMFLINPLSFSC